MYHLGTWTLRVTLSPAEGTAILGGSWVVISGVISRVTIVITQIRGLITPLITTPKPEFLKTPIEPFRGTLKGTP